MVGGKIQCFFGERNPFVREHNFYARERKVSQGNTIILRENTWGQILLNSK